MNPNLTRRNLLQGAAAAALAPQLSPQSGGSKKMIGIQIGAVSFVDEGVEKVLDILQERAYVNTLFLAVFTYGRGIAGRQLPNQPLPDHGAQKYDLDFHGGNYATVHSQYYQNTVLKDTRAPDHGDLDILATVIPAAKKRGMKTICWLEDVFRSDLPNIQKLQEHDLYGRIAGTLCFNNPDHRNFLTGLVEDYTRSYEIDGLMWGSERSEMRWELNTAALPAIRAASRASANSVRKKHGSKGSISIACERVTARSRNSFEKDAPANARLTAHT